MISLGPGLKKSFLKVIYLSMRHSHIMIMVMCGNYRSNRRPTGVRIRTLYVFVRSFCVVLSRMTRLCNFSLTLPSREGFQRDHRTRLLVLLQESQQPGIALPFFLPRHSHCRNKREVISVSRERRDRIHRY
jgi:hypothetical protein